MKFVLITLAAVTAFAQTKSLTCDNNNNRNDRQVSSCEVREQTIAYGGRLTVDGGVNGGVSIKGWDSGSVLVRSKVEALRRRRRARAKMIAVPDPCQLVGGAGERLRSGNEHRRSEGWSVSYEVFVPRNADLSLKTHNGGISIADVRGNIQFDAQNGGVNLKNLAGDVEGHDNKRRPEHHAGGQSLGRHQARCAHHQRRRQYRHAGGLQRAFRDGDGERPLERQLRHDGSRTERSARS